MLQRNSSTYRCEENKMLETSVEMSFFLETNNLLEVTVIDVCINTKHPLQNRLHEILKVWWEWHSRRRMKKINRVLKTRNNKVKDV